MNQTTYNKKQMSLLFLYFRNAGIYVVIGMAIYEVAIILTDSTHMWDFVALLMLIFLSAINSMFLLIVHKLKFGRVFNVSWKACSLQSLFALVTYIGIGELIHHIPKHVLFPAYTTDSGIDKIDYSNAIWIEPPMILLYTYLIQLLLMYIVSLFRNSNTTNRVFSPPTYNG